MFWLLAINFSAELNNSIIKYYLAMLCNKDKSPFNKCIDIHIKTRQNSHLKKKKTKTKKYCCKKRSK